MKEETQVIEKINPLAYVWQQEVIKDLLILKQNSQLPHAIMIEVETSVDSRAFGWQLVMSLLCLQRNPNQLACGECHHCQLMKANNYADFTFTTLNDNERTHKLNKDIKIDQIRQLIHHVSLTANMQSGKFALIYPAEKMNISSANSLLKTLEEPAVDTTLILMTHNSGKLPVTIRSRCQNWTVFNPQQETAHSWLIENGMDETQIDDYLDLAQSDAQRALELSRNNALQQLEAFRESLKRLLFDQTDVVTVVNSLKDLDNETLRLIIKEVMLSFVYRQLEQPATILRKQKIGELLDLIKYTNFVLQVEENNLNLQLQLEDVLISLKQIFNKGKNHARSKSGDTVTQYQG